MRFWNIERIQVLLLWHDIQIFSKNLKYKSENITYLHFLRSSKNLKNWRFFKVLNKMNWESISVKFSEIISTVRIYFIENLIKFLGDVNAAPVFYAYLNYEHDLMRPVCTIRFSTRQWGMHWFLQCIYVFDPKTKKLEIFK